MYREQLKSLRYVVVDADGRVMAVFRNPHHAVVYAKNYGFRVDLMD